MPKAEPHFDAGALLAQVQQQDVGLSISTNNPQGFLRILYKHMRAQPSLRCHIYKAPGTTSGFYLTRASAPDLTLAQEPEDA